jgi:hypothetical protein
LLKLRDERLRVSSTFEGLMMGASPSNLNMPCKDEI